MYGEGQYDLPAGKNILIKRETELSISSFVEAVDALSCGGVPGYSALQTASVGM